MTRPSIDAVMMQTAQAWATRGTCSRLQVGAVVARYGRILVTSYNGTVSGAPHCDHTCDCPYQVDDPIDHSVRCNSRKPCEDSVHAEANVVAFAARRGLPLYDSTLYCTHAPCLPCAKLLVNAGVERVVYASHYRTAEGLLLLTDNNVTVEKSWKS